jgi:response regulator RpfG family c-di-GMP phosphodiesterase
MPRERTILIVDDEPDMRAALRRSLYQANATFLEAGDGLEAVGLLLDHPVDAVISDFEMPRMDGLELLQYVRLRLPQVLRIMLTARADVNVAVRALNEGAVHRFLLKPWDRIDLRGIIDMGLRGRGSLAVRSD